MSGLTKKAVVADRILSTMLGVKEGELVSYAQLSKGLHKYIKDNDLKNLERKQPFPSSSPQLAEPGVNQPVPSTTIATAVMKKCAACGADVPADAVFCDLCGVRQ